jgi:predicted Fe-Mo cluster-binding NifX family protein
MKIAIPLTDSDEFSSHYGASAKFEVFEVDPPQRAVRRRMIVALTEAEPCAWPPFLQAAGVQLILVGGMGRGAQVRMAEHGIQVLAGVPMAAPEALVTAWLDGHLTGGANACESEGSHHGHHHDEHHHHHAGGCGCAD